MTGRAMGLQLFVGRVYSLDDSWRINSGEMREGERPGKGPRHSGFDDWRPVAASLVQ